MWNSGSKEFFNVSLRSLGYWEILYLHSFYSSKYIIIILSIPFYRISIFHNLSYIYITKFPKHLFFSREDMRNSFNFLLIALISMDSCYLIGAILESFRKCFYLASNAHLHLFPYFLYPGINIAGKIYCHNVILN